MKHIFIIALIILLSPMIAYSEVQYQVKLGSEVKGVYATEAEAKSAIADFLNQIRNEYKANSNNSIENALINPINNSRADFYAENFKIIPINVQTPNNHSSQSQGNKVRRKRRPQGNLNTYTNSARNSRLIKERARQKAIQERNERIRRNKQNAQMAYDMTMDVTQPMFAALSARAARSASKEASEELFANMASHNSSAVRGNTQLCTPINVQTKQYNYSHLPVIPDEYFSGKPFRSLDIREGGTGQTRSADLDMITETTPFLYPSNVSVSHETNKFWETYKENIYTYRFDNYIIIDKGLDLGFNRISKWVEKKWNKLTEIRIKMLSSIGVSNAKRIVTNTNAIEEFSVQTIIDVLGPGGAKRMVDGLDHPNEYMDKNLSKARDNAKKMVESTDFGY